MCEMDVWHSRANEAVTFDARCLRNKFVHRERDVLESSGTEHRDWEGFGAEICNFKDL